MADPVLQEDVLVNFIVGDERLMAVARELAKNINVIQSQTEKLTIGQYFKKLAIDTTMASQAFQDMAPGKILGDANNGFQAIQETLKGINASAGMAKSQIEEMNAGITQAAAETGASFTDMASAMKELYGSTGLKEGIGETLLNSERLGMVFDSSGASFSKLTASMVQFGEGTVDADAVMKSFDKTSGLTGKRMDDMLDTLIDVSKTMRNITGGGKQFGESMKSITAFSTILAAKFTEMGGDGAALNDLTKGILDPNKWGDIASKMPGMAGNMVQMQQAMVSGDMKTFGELMKDGAQRTAQMGSGMNALARSASGIDFTSAELLGKVDFEKMNRDAKEQADITARSAELTRSLSVEWTKFKNNMTKALMPAMELIVGALMKVMSWFNTLMSASDSAFGTVTTSIILLTGAFVVGLSLFFKLSKMAIAKTGELAGEVGKGVGKAVGGVTGGFMEALAKSATSLAKAAVPMIIIAGAMLIFAAAVWVLAKAFQEFNTVPFDSICNSMMAIGITFGFFAIVAALLSPVAPMIALVGLAFLVFAAAVWVLAQAMKAGAEGFAVMGDTFKVLDGLDLVGTAAGLLVMSSALGVALLAGMAWGTVGLIASAGLLLFGSSLEAFGKFGADAERFAKAMDTIGKTTGDIARLNSMDMSGIEKLGTALGTFSKVKLDVSFSTKGSAGMATMLETIGNASLAVGKTTTLLSASSALFSGTTMPGVDVMLSNLDKLTAAGAKFQAGDDKKLFAFADTVSAFMNKMNDEVKISVQTGADLALTDHTAATSEHQQTVERLLESIRDGIAGIGTSNSPQESATKGRESAWRPENLFGEVSETF